MKAIAFIFLLVIQTEAKLLPVPFRYAKTQDVTMMQEIRDIVLTSLKSKSLNAMQVFIEGFNGPFFVRNLLDMKISFNFFYLNCTYKIGVSIPITDEPGDIMTLLFVNDSMSLKFLTTSLHSAMYPISRYFVIIFSGCGLPNSSKEIEEIFIEFWKLQVADVILVCLTKDSFKIYTFYPYSNRHCNTVVPELSEAKDFGFPLKNIDFHNCSLKAAVFVEPPHFVGGTTKGIDAEMIKFLSKSLNFRFSPDVLTKSQVSKAHYLNSKFFKKVSFYLTVKFQTTFTQYF